MKYIVGARGSRLSISQTRWVVSELQKANPDAEYEIRTITTKGDTDSRPLFAIDQKGIFEKEIDRAVAQSKIDFAVHSLKDVPSKLDAGLVLACVPKRGPVNDVFISPDGSTLESIKSGAIIGTSSLRRAVQISRKRSDIVVKPIRGNIETRIKKATGDSYDAVVLAKAGISRLGISVSYSVLSADDFLPSPGQGAIAIVARSDDHMTVSMLRKIEDLNSRLEVEAERALSSMVDSGCRFPVGAYAKSDGDLMTINVSAFSVDGTKHIHVEKSGPKDKPESLGESAGKELYLRGIGDLALNWREKVEEWNRP